MRVKISVIGPVLNEVDFIGYSIMAALPYVHEFVYALDAKSDDGTRELLSHVKQKYAHEKLVVLDHPTFHPSDEKAYNGAFNTCIQKATGDVVWFLHPDMLLTSFPKDGLQDGPMAWTVDVTSYAKDMNTVITKGRTTKWKNLHARTMGLIYAGQYGSQNEDFYHSTITGKVYKHFGSEFSEYPFEVADSAISINHYCELKSYERRLEKMKLCLRTLLPYAKDDKVNDLALQHPRVTLDSTSVQFGEFEFTPATTPIPEVFAKYKDEFGAFKKELVHG